LDRIEEKLDIIITILTEDVKENCDKMGEHINFIETVYEDVKNPLGYICNKVKYLSSGESHKEIEASTEVDVEV